MKEMPTNDPRSMWQGLKREHAIMSIEEVRSKAQSAEAKARRTLFVAMTSGALLVALSVFVIVGLRFTPVRWIAAGMIVVTIITVYKAYSRIWARHSLAPETAVAGCIAFYRQELKAQYNSLQLIWRFMVPIVIFTFVMWGTIFYSRKALIRFLLPAMLLAILIERRREAQKVNRRLAALAEFETKESV